jgi:hypothetical protein
MRAYYIEMYREILTQLGVGKDEEVHELMQRPQREKRSEMPHPEAYVKNSVHQADLLDLPEDRGYKYCLCVIDVGTRICDAVPLKTKTAEAVLKGLKDIYYGHNHLDIPKTMIQVDSGSEFKGVVKAFFRRQGVYMRVSKVGRHRQQSVVEHMNYVLGKVIYTRMNAKELRRAGHINKEWVDILPQIIDYMNTRAKKKNVMQDPSKPAPMIGDRKKGKMEKVLKVGQLVRIPLDEPHDIPANKKLHGRFRAGDLRWERTPTHIIRISMRPNQPIMYVTERNRNVAYTRKQIQLVDE